VKKKYMPTGTTDESSRHLNRYREAMRQVITLPDPNQFKRVLMRLSVEPSPADVFESETVNRKLNDLFYEARLARDRYLTRLAHEVFIKLTTPKKEEESLA
jgi:hypothetical protein